jgi:hypothetical protein
MVERKKGRKVGRKEGRKPFQKNLNIPHSWVGGNCISSFRRCK